MPKKIRELKAILRKAGFTCNTKRGKGSHSLWFHPLLTYPINLSGSDGDDAYRYQEKNVRDALRDLQQLPEEDDEI